MKTNFCEIFTGFCLGIAVMTICVYGFSFLPIALIVTATITLITKKAVKKFNSKFETEV